MSKILNYNENETLATGFVRPKVTSLFFDKIWIPKSLINNRNEFTNIPKSILISEKKETRIFFNNNSKSRANFHKKTGIIYSVSTMQNSGDLYKIMEYYNSLHHVNSEELASKINYSINRDTISNTEFKYSINRNKAILLGSENFSRRYNLHISPIFHDLTDFEKELQNISQNDFYRSKSFKYNFKKTNCFINRNAFSICIQDFPSIKEDELSWEQVLDIRKDKKRNEQLKQFTKFCKKELNGLSPNEIREILEQEMDEYKEALKVHGIKTIIGTFTTLVSSISPIVSLLSKPDNTFNNLLSLGCIALNFAKDIYFANYKNPKNPIAYLYNLKNDIY